MVENRGNDVIMKLNGDLPAVLFPIEIGTREFDSKLVMASALAARGCRAIVGHKEAIKFIARSSKNVVWQGKSLFDAKAVDETVDQLLSNDFPSCSFTTKGRSGRSAFGNKAC